MKYFVMQREQKPLTEEEFGKWIPQHAAHMDKGMKEGYVLIAGPTPDDLSGICVLKGESEEAVRAFVDSDPMTVAGLQKCVLTEFIPKNYPECVEAWLGL